MKKYASLAVLATLAVFAIPATVFAAETSQSVRAATDATATSVAVNAGKMLYASNGQRIAAIYRVTSDGNPQIILDGKLVTVPASSLSEANGKVMTSLSKSELNHAH
jgi:hypothetical protein